LKKLEVVQQSRKKEIRAKTEISEGKKVELMN
jgi:hypothetical protein